MSIEQPKIESKKYIVDGAGLEKIEISRDDVLEEAAIILSQTPGFPDQRGEPVNHLKAKQAIREVLKNHGSLGFSVSQLERQMDIDAYEVLELLKK